MAGLIVALVFVVGFAGAILYFVTLYNGLINLDKSTRRAWSNIDVLLKQRHDELPKLVTTVEGYMAHERETLQRVIEARNRIATSKSVHETAEASGELTGALRQLFALAEGYPELKADASFQHLRSRISEIEDQISDRREFYNHAVNQFNIRIHQLPDVFIARTLNLSDREYFKATEADRQDVEISFSNLRRPGDQS
jgi:LemA protein